MLEKWYHNRCPDYLLLVTIHKRVQSTLQDNIGVVYATVSKLDAQLKLTHPLFLSIFYFFSYADFNFFYSTGFVSSPEAIPVLSIRKKQSGHFCEISTTRLKHESIPCKMFSGKLWRTTTYHQLYGIPRIWWTDEHLSSHCLLC